MSRGKTKKCDKGLFQKRGRKKEKVLVISLRQKKNYREEKGVSLPRQKTLVDQE